MTEPFRCEMEHKAWTAEGVEQTIQQSATLKQKRAKLRPSQSQAKPSQAKPHDGEARRGEVRQDTCRRRIIS